jgi:hypothetical protein
MYDNNLKLVIVGTVSGMVTCRLVIRCLVLNCNLDSCKITNNSSGVPTTPTPMPKSVQINFLVSVYNFTSSKNACPHTWCDDLIYRPVVVVLLESLKPSWIKGLSPSLVELGVWVPIWLKPNLIFMEFEWDFRVQVELHSYLFNLNYVSLTTLSH